MNLAAPIREAIVADSGVVAEVASYKGSYAVFTRRPVPDDANYPMIVISPDVSSTNEDGVNDERPILVRDVVVYGRNDNALSYRTVETIAYAVRDLFHRQRKAITVDDWSVVDVRTSGPRQAPVDDEQTFGLLVELTVRLARLN